MFRHGIIASLFAHPSGRGTKSLNDVLTDTLALLKDLIKQALLAQITGQGGGGLFAFLGSLFAPAAATGGLGRSGISKAMPTLPTYAPPASITAPAIRAASTASRTVSINVPINVKVEGGSRGQEADR